jgi:hypothetical protein
LGKIEKKESKKKKVYVDMCFGSFVKVFCPEIFSSWVGHGCFQQQIIHFRHQIAERWPISPF